MDPITQLISQFKAGYKTSEFWLVLIAGIWNAVYPAYNPNLSWQVQVSSLGALAAAAIYATVRGYVKGKRVSALAVVNGAINGAIQTVNTPAVVTSPTQTDVPPATPTTTTTTTA